MSNKLSEQNSPEIERIFQKALALHQAGDVQGAGPLYIDVLKAAPGHLGARNNLAMALQAIGRPRDAIPHFERVLAKKPDHPATLNNLGNALRSTGELEKAYAHYRRAAELKPDAADVHNNLGAVRSAQNRDKDAIAHYQKAIEIQPAYAEAHNNLANALQSVGRLEEAIAHYEKALSCKADYFGAHANLGIALQAAGRLSDAIAHFQTALSLRPGFAAVHRHLALIDPARVDVPQIQALLAQPDMTDEDAINLHFALGTVFRTQGRYDTAFTHFDQGNQLVRKTMQFDPDEHVAFVSRIIDVLSAENVRAKATAGSDSEQPVFIVGMPRSGTTLVEQILSSHPEIHGGGELEYFADLKTLLSAWVDAEPGYPEGVPALEDDAIRSMARAYLDELRGLSPHATRVTDKMPVNFISLGLIHVLFPRARFIHCLRDPRDTCVSIYFQYFTGHHPYAYDLAELAGYYRQYQRLMSHWHDLFPAQMLAVQYEDLVRDQETISRRMIAFLGLPWDERCLEFYRNERPVRSASNVQVRQPLYTDSIDQWRKYQSHLAPLLDALQEA